MSTIKAQVSGFEQKAIEKLNKLRENPEYKPNPLPGELTEDFPGQISEQERIKRMIGESNLK